MSAQLLRSDNALVLLLLVAAAEGQIHAPTNLHVWIQISCSNMSLAEPLFSLRMAFLVIYEWP